MSEYSYEADSYSDLKKDAERSSSLVYRNIRRKIFNVNETLT